MYYCKFILHVCTRTCTQIVYFDEEPVGTVCTQSTRYRWTKFLQMTPTCTSTATHSFSSAFHYFERHQQGTQLLYLV